MCKVINKEDEGEIKGKGIWNFGMKTVMSKGK